MNSSAFVSAIPVVSTTSPVLKSTSLIQSRSLAVAPIRRARTVTMVSEDKRVPQGFTAFSEQLNGRAAMIGFILAVATEAITGEGIVGQLSAIVKNLPFSS